MIRDVARAASRRAFLACRPGTLCNVLSALRCIASAVTEISNRSFVPAPAWYGASATSMAVIVCVSDLVISQLLEQETVFGNQISTLWSVSS